MQLSLFTDYSFRVLMYLAHHPDRYLTISKIAEQHEISRNHLVKVVHHLSKKGFIHSLKGQGGGLMLARAPNLINLRDVVENCEKMRAIVECFDTETNSCRLAASCRLKGLLGEAEESFLAVLGCHSLADIIDYKITPAETCISVIDFSH